MVILRKVYSNYSGTSLNTKPQNIMDTYNTVSYYYTRFYHVSIFELFVLFLIEIRVNLYLKNKWYHIIVKKVKIYYKKKKKTSLFYIFINVIFSYQFTILYLQPLYNIIGHQLTCINYAYWTNKILFTFNIYYVLSWSVLLLMFQTFHSLINF